MDLKALSEKLGLDDLTALPRDVSPRQYFRCQKDERSLILMLYPEADDANREELQNFIRIGAWLDQNGVGAPALDVVDDQSCYALLEDLGSVSFGRALRENILTQEGVYKLGTGILKRLSSVKPLSGLPEYQDGAVHEKRRQLIDYYVAYAHKLDVDDYLVTSFLSVWSEIEATLPPCPKAFVHGDFHLENIMLREGEGALIDYQDAMLGPMPYDLLNLLEDARADVPLEIQSSMIDWYCEDMSASEKVVFLKWYRVLAAQFHGRVLGLFIKLAAEQNRDSYLVHIPRLQNYMKRSLNDPILAPLKQWFEKEGVDFEPLKDLHGDHIRTAFRNMS